jgi:hypothetical protein
MQQSSYREDRILNDAEGRGNIMFAETHGTDRPGIEEQYSSAVNASDLTVHEEKRGPAHLLVAAGLSARGGDLRAIDKPSVAMGGALARLQAEWHSVEKPVRQQPKSVRQWIDELPKVKTGERVLKGKKVPIMTFDREGARKRHLEERMQLDSLHEQQLKFLAQKLPSRYFVRHRLFLIAILWELSEPEDLVAEVLKYWLSDTCQTCHGTGEIIAGDIIAGAIIPGEKVLTCPTCEGRAIAQVPRGQQGRRLFAYMEESKHSWAQTVMATARRMRTR